MGKLIEESAFIENKTRDYINQVSDRSVFMEGNFIPVTYYSKNEEASTEDIGLGNVVELVGSSSPIRFNKIENVPLYGVDTAELTYDYDEEEGLDSPIDSSGNLPSGIIKPKPDDYFVIPSLNKDYLFRVNNVSGSNIKGNFIYHIEFDITGSNVDILEERQVTESYKVDYTTNGANKLVVLESSLYDEVEELTSLIDTMRENYVMDFYNKKFNLFISKNNKYSNNLSEFINKTQLFIERKTFRKNIYIVPSYSLGYDYYKTLYYGLLYGTNYKVYSDLFNSIKFVSIPNKSEYNIFMRSYNKYYKDDWLCDIGDISFKNLYNDILGFDYSNIDSSFTDILEMNMNWVSKLFILNYISIEGHEVSKSSTIRKIIDDNINKTRFTDYSYIIVPCILYILITTRNKLLNLTNEL